VNHATGLVGESSIVTAEVGSHTFQARELHMYGCRRGPHGGECGGIVCRCRQSRRLQCARKPAEHRNL
jgi:hypothetical protein